MSQYFCHIRNDLPQPLLQLQGAMCAWMFLGGINNWGGRTGMLNRCVVGHLTPCIFLYVGSRSHLWMNNISGGILEDCPEDLVVPLKFDTKIL